MLGTAFGCELVELLHEGRRSAIYRARRGGAAGPSVLLKTCRAGADRERVRRLHHEWDVLQQLREGEGVVRAHALEREGDAWAIVLEDSHGVSLERLALTRRLALAEVLAIALGIVDGLDAIHGARWIHRDLNPSNIVSIGAGQRIQLIDFTSATRWEGQDEPVRRPGSLAYISPEQTGRLNRTVDHRTDFYSLGVILYELLAGALPFEEERPLEIVHAHLARLPPSLAEQAPQIPRAVVRVVLKLLAKDAEDRYQSTLGLRHDLARCLEGVRSGDTAMDFEIAKLDRPAQFRLPRRLYGREAELARMLACLEPAPGDGVRVLCLSGVAGVGKSAAAEQLAAGAARANALIASAAFEQLSASGPYAAYARVLDSLVRQVLADTAEELARRRASLASALSSFAPVLTELCPSLELVLGPQPPAPRLPAVETRTRLQQSLLAFLAALAAPGRRLCLIFDDAHWADADSTRLLKELVLGVRSSPVVVVVAHRPVEPPGGSELTSALSGLREAGVPVESIVLEGLTSSAVEALIRDATAADAPRAGELAALVVARTGGNAFFVRSFLQALSSDGVIAHGPRGWELDLVRARHKGITENIVDLLVDRIRRLPPGTRELLQVAACLGSRFDLTALSVISARPVGEELLPAIDAELVLPQPTPSALIENDPLHSSEYHFTHDRVRQAVLSLLDSSSRRELHLRAGRRLRASFSDAAPPRRLFEILGQLNQAADRLEAAERIDVARLNLRAARVALHGAAGAEALQLASAGIAAVGDGWQTDHYELTRDLHVTAAEAAFSVADHDALESLSRVALANVRAPLDGIKIRTLQGLVCHGSLRFVEAMAIFLDALADLGVDIPRDPTPEQVVEEQKLAAEALRGKRIADLRDLPTCEDPRWRAAAELLSKVILLGGSMSDRVMPIAACRLVRLSLEHGNTAESANGYTFYGQALSLDHDLDRAYQFGKLAIDVCHRFEDRAVRSQTYLYAHYQLMHWKAGPGELSRGLRTALDYGLDAASPFNAACSAMSWCISRFWSGEALSTLGNDFADCHQVVARFRQDLVLNWHEIWQQLVSNLRLDPPSPTELSGPSYEEAVRLPLHLSARDASALFNYHLAKAFLCHLLGDHPAALEHADALLPLSELFGTGFWAFPLAFVDSLCRLAGCARAPRERREELLAQVDRTLAKMHGWLPHNPGMLAHRVKLLQAERAWARGDGPEARRLFPEAVQLAAAAGVSQDEALSSELAARCCIGMGDREAAREHLRGAHRAYLKWGAFTKVRALEREFPGLLPRVATGSVNVLAMAGRDNEFDPLDLVTLIDAGQVISSEIKLDRLLLRLLQLLMESAGAQSVCLLMERGGQWVIEAGQSSEDGQVTLLESLGVDHPKAAALGVLPSVINYVTRTGEAVLLEDAAQSPLFGQDAARAPAGPLSLSCFGLKRQGQTLAVAYLVNRLVRAAFTPKGQRLLEALSSQAVTSLENAILYAQLERKVAERTSELVQKNEELTSALVRLTEMREQLVTREKLAALGALTAGIAHEIKNPLNFVTNFALVSASLVEELRATLASDGGARAQPSAEAGQLLDDLAHTVKKINEHGGRASSIVTGMALHARESGGPREHADLNEVLSRSMQLACESRRGGAAPIAVQTEFEPSARWVELVVEDMTRVFVNLINNAFYSVEQKRSRLGPRYEPVVSLRTRDLDERIEVRIRDNGTGIPPASRDKIFLPFFTTKPPREGTGLGLSISHDIVVRAHGGQLRVDSVEGEYAEFILVLPRRLRLSPLAVRSA